LVLLNAQEGGFLYELPIDDLWPIPDQPFDARRDLAREAVKDLVSRGWIRVIVARGWPHQSDDESNGQDLVALLDDEASWRYADQSGLPNDQVMHIEIDATEAGLLAIKDGAAPDAYRRLSEHLNKHRHE
jgi:hypothetical protein